MKWIRVLGSFCCDRVAVEGGMFSSLQGICDLVFWRDDQGARDCVFAGGGATAGESGAI